MRIFEKLGKTKLPVYYCISIVTVYVPGSLDKFISLIDLKLKMLSTLHGMKSISVTGYMQKHNDSILLIQFQTQVYFGFLGIIINSRR